MTLILKSNVTAKKFFSDKTGLRDTDYLFNADFTQSFFRVAGTTGATFKDIIDYSRSGLAYFYQGGPIKSVNEDTPVWVGPDQKNGLWQQYRAGNKLGSGEMVSSKAAKFTQAADLGAEMALQVWGDGSVKVVGDVESSLNNVATQDHPIIFKTKNNNGAAAVNFEVTGRVDYYQVQRDNIRALLNPSPTTVNKANIYVKSNLLRDEFSLLLRIKPYYNPKQSTVAPLFELASNNNLLVGYLATDGSFRVTARNNINAGATVDNLQYNDEIVIALKFRKSGLAAYYQGEKVLDITANQYSAISCIKLLGSDNFTPTTQFNGMLKNMACYIKSMSDDELGKLSLSFS